MLSTFAPRQGLELCALGRFEEAERLALKGRELGDEDDAYTQALWRQALARARSASGDHAEAERLAREAVAITDETDSSIFRAVARCDIAEVLAAAGRTHEAVETLEQALELYERKKNLPMAAQVRNKLEELRAHVS